MKDYQHISIKISDMDAQDQNGWTALLVAAKCGFRQITLDLIEAGADLSILSNLGDSALYWIAKHKWSEIYHRLTSSNEKEIISGLVADAIKCSKLYNDSETPKLLVSQTFENFKPVEAVKLDINMKVGNTSG